MLILVKLIGVIIVAIGIIFLLRPKTMRQYIAFWLQEKRLYIGSILSILIGILFLLAASQCRLTGVIVTLGVISLAKGIIILIRGLERLKSMLNWWDKRSPLVIRLIALLDIGIGALLLYSV